MAAEKRRECKAISKQSGKRCKNKAVSGSDYCRLHGGGALGNKGGKGRPKGSPKPPGAGAPPPKGNTNALQHGAYSSRLPAEEIPLYEELLARYKKDVHEPSETDLMTLERLALYETKLRVAVAGGAPADALDVLDRLLNRNLKALQVTRESKETTRTTGATPAEVMGALLARVRERGLLPTPPLVEAEVIDVEVVEVREDSDSEG